MGRTATKRNVQRVLPEASRPVGFHSPPIRPSLCPILPKRARFVTFRQAALERRASFGAMRQWFGLPHIVWSISDDSRHASRSPDELALALASSSVIPAHGGTLFFSENFDATTPTEHNC